MTLNCCQCGHEMHPEHLGASYHCRKCGHSVGRCCIKKLCKHSHLDMDGICFRCGSDQRGIGDTWPPSNEEAPAKTERDA